MRRRIFDRLMKTSVQRGLRGGSQVFRSVAVVMLVIRGAKRLGSRHPQVVRRVRMRPGTAMTLAVRRGGNR